MPSYAYVGGGNLQVNKHAPLRIKVNPNVDSLGSCLHGALFSVHVEAWAHQGFSEEGSLIP